jgi:hypothetical protein
VRLQPAMIEPTQVVQQSLDIRKDFVEPVQDVRIAVRCRMIAHDRFLATVSLGSVR